MKYISNKPLYSIRNMIKNISFLIMKMVYAFEKKLSERHTEGHARL